MRRQMHTLGLLADSQIVINPHLYKSMPFDPLRDLTPVHTVAGNQFVLTVNPQLPVRSFPEFIDYARKSNPPLLEWLNSPLVYCEDAVFVAELRELAAQYYSPRRCFAHYLHMAHGNWHKYLRGRAEVSLKKYLYVFRPLLAARWIERELGQVPMLFQQLLDDVLEEAEVRAALDELVARKMAGLELAVAPPVEVLSDFIPVELARLDSLVSPAESDPDVEMLNSLFRRYALAL